MSTMCRSMAEDAIGMLMQAIKRSGLSARRYATEVLKRDERTIRKWLAGDNPIPEAVLRFLREEVAQP